MKKTGLPKIFQWKQVNHVFRCGGRLLGFIPSDPRFDSRRHHEFVLMLVRISDNTDLRKMDRELGKVNWSNLVMDGGNPEQKLRQGTISHFLFLILLHLGFTSNTIFYWGLFLRQSKRTETEIEKVQLLTSYNPCQPRDSNPQPPDSVLRFACSGHCASKYPLVVLWWSLVVVTDVWFS